MALTATGWEGVVRHLNRKLVEIDKLDEELGDHCREARVLGREMLLADLAKAKASLAGVQDQQPPTPTGTTS